MGFTPFERIFFTGSNDFWETPDFLIYVELTIFFRDSGIFFLVFLWVAPFEKYFFTGSNNFLETQIFLFLWN